jgi:uncharacterized protein (TIGR00251 family)
MFFKEKSEGILINVFVQPRSAKNTIVGPYKDELKIKLTAAPVGGAANKMCINFLAKCLKIPKSSIEITAGHTTRSKKILIQLPDKKSDQKKRQHVIQLLSSFVK